MDIGHFQDAMVRPPRGSTGPMDRELQLGPAGDSIADRRSMWLEWLGGNKTTVLVLADTGSPAAEPQAPQPRRAMRPEERQAMASLVSRGKERAGAHRGDGRKVERDE